MVEERRAAGDNDGNRRDRYALAREKDRGETGSDGCNSRLDCADVIDAKSETANTDENKNVVAPCCVQADHDDDECARQPDNVFKAVCSRMCPFMRAFLHKREHREDLYDVLQTDPIFSFFPKKHLEEEERVTRIRELKEKPKRPTTDRLYQTGRGAAITLASPSFLISTTIDSHPHPRLLT
ncbi:hypothetical protein EAG_13855 [Camponotus floridanus]|uniref:Uncharacterized protein n=1 Tax=Camponotus floridanus TaxID=104421 RepID=E2AVI9_CAMFO|nr:hypothetical protein EAG_13855 [Camponotus floridanus]